MIRITALAGAAVLAMAALITLQQWIVADVFTRQAAFWMFVGSLVDWGAWALLTPLIVLLARRVPVMREGRVQPGLLLHTALALAATAIWSLPVAAVGWTFGQMNWADMVPVDFGSSYLVVLLGRSFYYGMFYALVVGVVTARQLSQEAQQAAAEAALIENEVNAADLEAARIQYDPAGLAAALSDAARMVARDPPAAEARILETAAELQRTLSATRPSLSRRAA